MDLLAVVLVLLFVVLFVGLRVEMGVCNKLRPLEGRTGVESILTFPPFISAVELTVLVAVLRLNEDREMWGLMVLLRLLSELMRFEAWTNTGCFFVIGAADGCCGVLWRELLLTL